MFGYIYSGVSVLAAMCRSFCSRLGFSSLALAASYGTAAASEPVDVGVHTQLKAVTATATRSTRDPFEIAESVSVVDRDDIETEQATNLGDLLKRLPNISIAGGPRGVAQQIVIRGVGDERVLFLLDGARQNFSRAHNGRVFVDPDLLKQVEVLRGPASALWGSGAIGGVVALDTVDAADLLTPGEKVGARLKLGYQGVNDQWRTGASAYGLVGDSVDLLADFSYRDAGDIDLGDGTSLNNSGFDSLAGLFKFTWSPGVEHNVSATLQTFDEEREVPSNAQTAGAVDDLVDRETQQHNLSLRYSFEPESAPLLRPSLLLFRNRNDISEKRLRDDRKDDTELVTWGMDLRNRFVWQSGSVANTLSIGVDYFKDEAEATRNGVPRESFPDAEQDVLGIYVHDEIQIGDRLTLVPGLRWDRYESESSSGIADGQDESELSKKLSVSYELLDWLTVHAAYNEAFRAPGMSELFVSGTHFTCPMIGPGCANLFIPNPNLKPEKAHNTELGLSARQRGLFRSGDEGSARISVFQNDVDDFIDQIVNFTFAPVPGNPGQGGVSFFENVSDARLEGFEIEVAYDASDWFANLGYGRTRGENRETGEALSDIPAAELTAGVGLRVGDMELGWDSRFVDSQDRVPAGGTTTSSYDLHDIYLTWKPQRFGKDKLRVDVGIDNLFDRDYRPHLSVLNGPGRNLKASVAVKF